jgi:O-antigen/teichoic acid export membrane protein
VAGSEHLRVAATIQLALGAVFVVGALVFRAPLQNDLFNGSATLYWILIAAVLAYAASYFARGFLAGHRRFALYGGLVFMESLSRFLFALAVTVGVLEGQAAVALGMAAAPLVSLTVVAPALARHLTRRDRSWAPDPAPAVTAEPDPPAAPEAPGEPEFTLSHGTGFALAVLAIMLAEQTFLNAGPLLVRATEGERGAALAGFAFNVLLLARAPLVLFQAVQTSILPHLTRLWVGAGGAAEGDVDPFRRSVNVTLAAIGLFAGSVALVMAAVGPQLMGVVFGGDFDYDRGGLVLVAVAMGLYLSAATVNQALLAQGRARQAAAAWVGSAAAFVVFLLLSPVNDPVLSVEVGLLGGAAVLCTLLLTLYRRA